MENGDLNWIAHSIWGIADDVPRRVDWQAQWCRFGVWGAWSYTGMSPAERRRQ